MSRGPGGLAGLTRTARHDSDFSIKSEGNVLGSVSTNVATDTWKSSTRKARSPQRFRPDYISGSDRLLRLRGWLVHDERAYL
jgi:hypothetical protein